ncbi:MAG: hypothetical protein V2B18_18840, partial [Pseudomonadota bacterium]
WVDLRTNTVFRLPYGDDGVHTGTVRGIDENGATRTENFTIVVNNLAPVFTGNLADQIINQGQTATVDFTGMFTDVAADELTYAYQVDNGEWMALGTDTTFSLTFEETGVHRVVVRALDDDGAKAYSLSWSYSASYIEYVEPYVEPFRPPTQYTGDGHLILSEPGLFFRPPKDPPVQHAPEFNAPIVPADVRIEHVIDTTRPISYSTVLAGPAESGFFTITVKSPGSAGFGPVSFETSSFSFSSFFGGSSSFSVGSGSFAGPLAVSTSSGLSPVSSSSGYGYSPSPEAGSGYSVVASAGYGSSSGYGGSVGVGSAGMPSSDAASSSHGGPHAGAMPNAGGAAGPAGSYSHAPTAQSSSMPYSGPAMAYPDNSFSGAGPGNGAYSSPLDRLLNDPSIKTDLQRSELLSQATMRLLDGSSSSSSASSYSSDVKVARFGVYPDPYAKSAPATAVAEPASESSGPDSTNSTGGESAEDGGSESNWWLALVAQTGGVVGALVEAVRRTASTNRNTAMNAAGVTPADPEAAPRGYAKKMYEYITGTYASAADVAQTSEDAASEHYQKQHDYGITESITNFHDTGEEISFTYVVTEEVTESYYEAEGETLYEVTKTYEVKKEYPVTYEYGNAEVGFDFGEYDSTDHNLSDYHVSQRESEAYDPSNFCHTDYGWRKCDSDGSDQDWAADTIAFLEQLPDSVDKWLEAEAAHGPADGDEKTSSRQLVEEFSKLREETATAGELYDAGYWLAQQRIVTGQPIPDKKDLDLNDNFWRGFNDGVVDRNLFVGSKTTVYGPSPEPAPDTPDPSSTEHGIVDAGGPAANSTAADNDMPVTVAQLAFGLSELPAEPPSISDLIRKLINYFNDSFPMLIDPNRAKEAAKAAKIAAKIAELALEMGRAASLAKKIADGHGYQKHVEDQFEYQDRKTGKPISREEYQKIIQETVSNPSDAYRFKNGRTMYWGSDGTIVFQDPNAEDGGPAFRPDPDPKVGKVYFDDLKAEDQGKGKKNRR